MTTAPEPPLAAPLSDAAWHLETARLPATAPAPETAPPLETAQGLDPAPLTPAAPPLATAPSESPDERIWGLASRQHGVVSARQLRQAGVPRGLVRQRLRTGLMLRVARGVYAVGPIRGPHSDLWTALLLGGESATLSYRTAASLMGFEPRKAGARTIHVSVPVSHMKTRSGMRFHRALRLPPREVTTTNGLPTTTCARTLLDLSRGVPIRRLEDLVARADRMGLLSLDDLQDILGDHPGHPGTARLRDLLGRGHELAFTRSELESRFLALVRSGGLTEPSTNVRVAGFEVDFVWSRAALVVEVDGFRFHGNRRSFEKDRRRDAILVSSGFRVLRFTWHAVVHRPGTVLVRIAETLALVRAETR